MLDRDEERELDGLLRHDRLVRLGIGCAHLVEELVGVGLQPVHLRLRRNATWAPRQSVQAGIGGDPVQPRAERRPALEARALSPRTEERLLGEVLRLLERAEHPVAVDLELWSVALDEPGEGRLVPGLRGGDRRLHLISALHSRNHAEYDWRRKEKSSGTVGRLV